MKAPIIPVDLMSDGRWEPGASGALVTCCLEYVT